MCERPMVSAEPLAKQNGRLWDIVRELGRRNHALEVRVAELLAERDALVVERDGRATVDVAPEPELLEQAKPDRGPLTCQKCASQRWRFDFTTGALTCLDCGDVV